MATQIKCPNCSHAFAIEDAVSEEYKKELREQMLQFNKRKEAEFAEKEKMLKDEAQKKEAAFQQQLLQQKKQLQEELAQSIRKNVAADYENQLKILEEQHKSNEEKLKLARDKELQFLRREQELKSKEQELEIALQKQLQEERVRLSDEIRKQEEQKNAIREQEMQMRMKELEKQVEQQKKLAEEMKRKAEQGSMQLQGEVQELALEELLKNKFPIDLIEEVGKGIRGADCILTVRNQFGQNAGKIIFESKRTKNFDKEWIEKLKADMRSTSSDLAVIVTQTMPDQQQQFLQIDGIWICTFNEVAALTQVLRQGILKVYQLAASQENRGDKMHMLYDYLTSNEFGEQWKAIREGFQAMRASIQKERDAMEKLWKAREKQLEKVLLNAAHIKGSIEGIAGSDNIRLNLTDDDELDLID
nr:DUF2130 domain-containing protein [Gynurincola endophyticus]